MNASRQIPQDSSPSLLILGEVGEASRLDAVRAGQTSVGAVDIRVIAADNIADLTPAQIGRKLAETGAWVVCLGTGLGNVSRIEIAEQALALHPGLELILLADPSPEVWAEASRSGIREVVSPHAGDAEFTTALDATLTRVQRLHKMLQERAEAARRTARVIVILSPKGGSGKTTVSTNLAAALASKHPDRVALIDFDCQFGDVATAVGIEPERTLTELGQVPHLDASTIKLFLTRHSEAKFYVLPSSGRPDEADLIDEPKATEILELLSTDFDYLVVDTAAGIDERSLAAMNLATDLLFVASMDITSIRNLAKELEILDHLDLPPHGQQFVINRVDHRAGLKISEIESSIGMKAAQLIDTDPLVLTRLNQGRPLVVSDPRSNLAKKFMSLAETYLPEEEKSEGRSKWSIGKKAK
jgi:pilus assembly protein CpaE